VTTFVIALALGFALVFATFFVWNRLLGVAEQSEAGRKAWSHALVSAILATLLFLIMFALGVWFSIARLKGAGWFPLA
jgi:hypothetical protein